jgi:hypothetical protein
MRRRTSVAAFGGPLTLVAAGASTPNRGRAEMLLLWASVLVVAAIVWLLGIRVLPMLLLMGHPGPGPVQSSIVAVGNLRCDAWAQTAPTTCSDRDIARLVDALDPALVLPLGDTALPAARSLPADETARVWHRLRPRIHAVKGDRDGTVPASDFEDATPPSPGYYSYDYAGWHFIALNGNCAEVGGCGPGSPQERWLASDLRRSRAKCTLAYWHQPRFSSGRQGSDAAYDAFWRNLYEGGAELVLNGHVPSYERFARQSPDAALDVRRGLRQFVVGTGSVDPTAFKGRPLPRSVVRNAEVPGVLQLVLRPQSYRWQFVPVFGQRFKDTGIGTCH